MCLHKGNRSQHIVIDITVVTAQQQPQPQLQLTNKIIFWDNMDQITWVRDGVMITWNKVKI